MQATSCVLEICRKGGIASWHSGIAIKQRGWKLHPRGGFMGLGTSPFKIIRSRFSSTNGSGIGTAESKAFV